MTDYLEQCRTIARLRGGECSARRYENAHASLAFRCGEGHSFAMSMSNLKAGKWCRICRRAEAGRQRREATFARLRLVALERGGACLSPSYDHDRQRLRWRCAEGHAWSATTQNVAAGKWCARCAGVARLTIEQMRRLARARGGACLSQEYVNTGAHLRWRCREGHEWSAAPADMIHRGRWCPHCAGNAPKTLDEIRALASERGGELLSRAFVRTADPLDWRCHLGHEFTTSANAVQQGGWCPKCLGTPKSDLERLRDLARRRGGECLSSAYTGSYGKLRWRCRRGHEWRAAPNNVASGSWCPECVRGGGPYPPLGLADMHETAEARGGRFLSEEYEGSQVKHLWRCASGHEWEARPAAVRHGSWCPECARRYRGSIDGLRLLASDRGGECLSPVYEGKRKPLAWRCRHGHRFELTSLAAKSGAWCPRCRE